MAAVPHRASLFPVAKLRRRLESSKAAGPALKLPLVSKHSTGLLIVAIGSARMDVGRLRLLSRNAMAAPLGPLTP